MLTVFNPLNPSREDQKKDLTNKCQLISQGALIVTYQKKSFLQLVLDSGTKEI